MTRGYDSSVGRAKAAGLAALAVSCLALLAAAPTLADGDPASDVLFGDDVYVPYPPPSRTANVALRNAVAAVYAHRYRLKVAVIATPTDLGAIPSLFGKADAYAHFLADELSAFYVGPLLVVMPSGYGVYDGGRSTAAEEAVLSKLRVDGSSRDSLAASATKAAQQLLAKSALRSKDILPPYLYLQPLTMTAGKPARLIYKVADDSHRSRETIRVETRTGKVLATVNTPFHVAYWSRPRAANWTLPQRVVKPGIRYCIVSRDASGNATKSTCEPISIARAR